MLMLRLIARGAGEELAQQTSRMLLIDPERQSQAPYVSEALMAKPRNSLSEKAEHFLNHELHREIGQLGSEDGAVADAVGRLVSEAGTE